MEGIIMDDCLKYLMEAQRYLDMYEEIDSYAEIFEASNPEVAAKIKNNQIAENGTKENMSKASNALTKMIQNIILAIKNFFGKRNIDGAKRAALEQYKAQCAKDPSLKNKKINMLDINKFTAEGNGILKEAEEIDAKLAAGQDVDTTNILSKLSKYCAGTAAGLVVPVGIEAALQAASSSKEIAQSMLKTLNSDLELQKQLDAAVGKKNAKAFKKDLEALGGKRMILRRKILQAKGYQAQSVEDAIEKTFNSLGNLIGGGTDIAAIFMNDKEGNDPSRSKLGDLAHTAGNLWHNRKQVKQGVSTIGASGVNMAKNMTGNEQIKDLIGSGVKLYGQAKQTAKDQYKASEQAKKNEEKARKAAEKYRKGVAKDRSNQSARDALFGNNDPNATASHSKAGQTAQKAYNVINR